MKEAPRLAVAFDVNRRDDALRAAAPLREHADIAKVGLELFIAAGPEVVTALRSEGWDVFLDLKLHDIPATVAGAVRAAMALEIGWMTLHTSGGRAMIAAAVEARAGASTPRLLGVSILTSLDARQVAEVGMRGGVAGSVERLAALAHDAGCDGLVCSPLEVERIKAAHGSGFLVVTPGIRPAAAVANDDQARVATVAGAVAAGADVLVIGRPILKSADPAAAAAAIRREMEETHGRKS